METAMIGDFEKAIAIAEQARIEYEKAVKELFVRCQRILTDAQNVEQKKKSEQR